MRVINIRFILLCIFTISSLFAGDAKYNRGEMLFFSKGCNGCHGASAEGGGVNPRLAGKKKSYLINKLRYFRKGKVGSQTQEMMVQFTLKLSDKDIDDLATFFSEHKQSDVDDISNELLGGFGS